MPAHLDQDGHFLSHENSFDEENQIKDDEIVISGMAGRFPESDNVEEFWENLINGRDMATEREDRWPKGMYNLPPRNALLKDASKLDAVFFGIAPKQANLVVPEIRNSLELTYECIVDAGIDPSDLRGKKIGVYVGSSTCETEELLNTHMAVTSAGYSLLGVASCMLSNRISFFYDFKGPSVTINAACAASSQVLDVAIRDIRVKKCDAAIIVGENFCLRPSNAIYFMQKGMLSPDGKCRAFDDEANGYVRADSVGVLLLQQARTAKRIYASVAHIKAKSDGYRTADDDFATVEEQIELFEETYKEASIDPKDISYLEAHGTAIKMEDILEVNAVSAFFCKNRTEPLLMGSVKSNMGFSEGASGIVSIIKVLLAMHHEMIPPNLNFNKPDPSMTAIVNGQIIIPTKPTPWKGQLAAINNYGRGGVNAHIILRGYKARSPNSSHPSPLPRIIAVCCRTEQGLQEIMKKLETTEISEEGVALLDDVNKLNPSLFLYRGFLEKRKDKTEITMENSKIPHPKGTVWYVFSGMGSQWPKMGKELMHLDLFKNSIQHLNKVLRPFGVDLIHLLIEADEQELGTTTASFISITAVQIAFVDILSALGIKPDGIIGHSIGEVACAYADGCITAEQAITIAFWRGKCIDDAKLSKGGMAAIGLSLKELERKLPTGVVAACHNARDSVTISGLEAEVMKFVDDMKHEGIFARYVNTCGIAFHSPYMKDVGPSLRNVLEKIIPEPRRRSSRWISTSLIKSEWNTSTALFASPDYFVNNLLAPVLFEEGIQMVPPNAVVIEIAPHSLLQAVLKRCLNPSCKNIGLTKKTHPSNLEHFFISLGKLYLLGMDIPFKKLYPKVKYPVSNGTIMTSTLLRWDHSQKWFMANWRDFYQATDLMGNALSIDLSNPTEEMAYIAGHCIDGRILFPATGYLMFAWKVFSGIIKRTFGTTPIAFENCTFHRATIIPNSGTVTLSVTIHPENGKFEISEGGSVACSGRIYMPNKDQLKKMITLSDVPTTVDEKTMVLNQKDIYTELRLKGYDYKEAFQSLEKANLEGTQGTLKWNGNFITFLDGMMQLAVLGGKTRGLHVPTHLRSLIIDSVKINSELYESFGKEKTPTSTGKSLPIVFDKYANLCITTGVEMTGLKPALIERRQNKQIPILEKYHFVPYMQDNILNAQEEKDINSYIAACSTVAKAILANTKQMDSFAINFGELPELTEDQVNDILEKQKKKGVLLETLKQIQSINPKTLYEDEVQKIVSDYLKIKRNDKLYQITVHEKAIRSPLDIALENLNTNKVTIVEVLNKELIGNEILNYLHTSPAVMKPKFTVAYKNDNKIDLNELGRHMKEYQWNPKADLPAELQNTELVVAKDPFESTMEMQEFFESVTNMVGDHCFLLLVRRTSLTPAETLIEILREPNVEKQQVSNSVPMIDQILKHAEEKGFVAVSRKSHNIGLSIILFRKVLQISASDQAVIYVKEGDYAWVEDLKKKMTEYQQKPEGCNIWLTANDTSTNGIIGLVNCLRQEPGGEKIRCIFQNNLKKNETFPALNFDVKPYSEMLKFDLVMNILRDGELGTFRHETLPPEPEPKHERNVYLNVAVKGDLSSLRWFSSPTRRWGKNAKLCDVYCSALNFRDVMIASGKLPVDALPANFQHRQCVLGLEYAGRDRATGKRIMGMVTYEGIATTIHVDQSMIWNIPDNWTLEDACTVPIAYSTAYYAMIIRGKMKKGSSVLIHSGSGGVGQAAIAIALSMGCNVFVTVGTYEKRKFLKKRFPQLKEENFASSRDTAFENQIIMATNGRGVDVVLNSLAEEKLQASVRCLAQFGKFLEIGKYDLSQDNKLGLQVFEKGITFHGILLDSLMDASSRKSMAVKNKVTALVQEGIDSGVVRPLPRKVFRVANVEDAFRYMASGKHIGKIVIKIRDEEPIKVTKAPIITIPALPYTVCDSSKSYVITGGLGGFGLELAGWLIERGAKYLILSSRSGVRTGYQQLRLKLWKEKGIEVSISNHDVCSFEGAIDLLQHAQKFGPIGGIFHLAMVLEDAFFENQTEKSFTAVCKPKVSGTHHLDQASRIICSDVEWFVVFSSLSCGRGNAGQSNYGFANSVMERICERRKEDGLAGTAIQWGAIGDVGILQERMGGNNVIIGGTIPQRMFSCLAVLDRFLHEDNAVLSSFVKVDNFSREGGAKQNLIDAVANVLGIKNLTTIGPDVTLGALGLDSLMGVEVKQTLERDYDIVLSMQEIRNMTFAKLAEMNEAYNSGNKSQQEDNGTPEEISETPHAATYFVMPKDVWVAMNSAKGDNPLFVIHSIEGTVDNLKPLASLLSFPLIGIQCTKEAMDCNSIEELAVFYTKVIQNICPSGPYNILGYSFGAIVAFEIAAQMQARAENGSSDVSSLIMIDGSPLFLTYEAKAQKEHLKIETTAEEEAGLLAGFVKCQGLNLNFSQLTLELSGLSNKEERLNKVVDTILPHLPKTVQKDELLEAANAFIRRTHIAQNYIPRKKFKGNVSLIKAKTQLMSKSVMPSDYGLSQVIEGEVSTYEVNGDHLSIIQGEGKEDTAEIIKKIIT